MGYMQVHLLVDIYYVAQVLAYVPSLIAILRLE